MDQVRVLLLAQSPVLRFGIQAMLVNAMPIERVVECNNALDAAAPAPDFDPHLIIIQFALPGVNGMLAARMLRDLHPNAKIAILSDYTSDADIVLAVQYGADALLPAAIEPGPFLAAINDLMSGRALLTDIVLEQPALAARMFDAIREAGAAGDQATASPALLPTSLSPREIVVLDGSVRGLTLKEIGEAAAISEHAMKALVASLLVKLDAADRTTAIVAAVRAGLVVLSHHLPAQQPAAPNPALPPSYEPATIR
jgi:DNA-binding NarL/FixJ family response regulator